MHTPRPQPPDGVTRMLTQISAERMGDDIERLAGFGTRHTLSDTESSTRGIGAARRWILGELKAATDGANGRSYLETFAVEADGRRITRTVDVVNVIAELPGTEGSSRRFYVIAHYDSRATDPLDAEIDAPGANDDASGVAVVLETARVLATMKHEATLVFMATAGEEQGLYGARRHAAKARETGVDVRAVLSNDIVGDPTSPIGKPHRDQVRVFSEGVPAPTDADGLRSLRRLASENDSPSRQVARYVAEVAALHDLPVQPLLVNRTDRFLRGGDHTAFNEQGYAAVRLTEVAENYDRQHQDVRTEGDRAYGDLPDHVDSDYLADVARVNAAALAHLANAPSPPGNARIVAAALTPDTTLRWDASPEGDVAGYEIVWRDTTAPRWEHTRDVGQALEVTLPLNKDNVFLGIRAYDRSGFRSPVAFPIAAKE